MIEWCPFATRIDGPLWKQGYPGVVQRFGKGAVTHSMEGRWQAALSRLDSSDLASWQFSLTYDGLLMQHYPLSACCWHAGNYYANTHFFGVECEGRAGEMLTGKQVDKLVQLYAWADKVEGWPYFEYLPYANDHATLQEHRFWAATACPSGRVPFEEIERRLNMPEDPCALYKLSLAWQEDMQKLALGGINVKALGLVLLKWDKIVEKK